MRVAATLLLIPALSGPLLCTAAEAPPASRTLLERRADIQVVAGGWGNARTEEIKAVLDSIAAILLEHFPGRRLSPISVRHTDQHPATLYRRGPNDAYRVFLSAQDRRWARYAYEFAHELSHILSNYEHHVFSKMTTFNQWFEEALCETASIYALKRLAVAWEIAPPYPHWAAYAPAFERHAQRLLTEPRRRLPHDMSLAGWLERNEPELRSNPYLRGHNEIVANLLLPLFEENPQIWEAIGYLNPGAKSSSFREYLRSWHASAPEDYKDIIRYIMALFGFSADETMPLGDPGRTRGAPPPARR